MRQLPIAAHARGASLVETLVALALGLLVLVLSTRSVLAVVVGESRQGAARTLAASLEFARGEAAQRRSPVALCGLDPVDHDAPSGQVHCAPAGTPWRAGWIVFGDADMNGELDDGEAVLQVSRSPNLSVSADGAAGLPAAAVTFRPIGTLASASPRRLMVGSGDGAATQVVCVAIDGHTRVIAPAAVCQ
jgi:type IV fimbrial biogenesis protein FimT